jgi:hypothetical protein
MGEVDIFDLTRKQMYWGIAAFMVVIAALILVFAILPRYQQSLVEVPQELRAELISLRFVNTPECFTYQDQVTGRIFAGVIDLQKFTQERMDQCYRTEPEKGFKDFNFALELEGYTPTLDGKKKLLMSNNFFNKVDFTLYKQVLVRNGQVLEPARMIIHVQARI